MNKMEKMFVDYWLLDIDEAIMRYVAPQSNYYFIHWNHLFIKYIIILQ